MNTTLKPRTKAIPVVIAELRLDAAATDPPEATASAGWPARPLR